MQNIVSTYPAASGSSKAYLVQDINSPGFFDIHELATVTYAVPVESADTTAETSGEEDDMTNNDWVQSATIEDKTEAEDQDDSLSSDELDE